MPIDYVKKMREFIEEQYAKGNHLMNINDLQVELMKKMGTFNEKTVGRYIEGAENLGLLVKVSEVNWKLMSEEEKIKKIEKDMAEKEETKKKAKKKMEKASKEVDAKLDAYAKGKPE